MHTTHVKKYLPYIIGVVVIIILFIIFKPSRDLDRGSVTIDTAPVDEVGIIMMESFPLQVMATVKGDLPDGCTELGDTRVSYEDRLFTVTLPTVRDTSAVCTQALVPYQENIPLEVHGLPKGEYTVNVNGVTATFEFIVDNILEFDDEKS